MMEKILCEVEHWQFLASVFLFGNNSKNGAYPGLKPGF